MWKSIWIITDYKLLLFFILISQTNLLFSQDKNIKVYSFNGNKEKVIKGINIDKIVDEMPEDSSVTIIIIRAESTKPNDDTLITPLEVFINSYDTSLIHIHCFELNTIRFANFYKFIFTINNDSNNIINGIPPFLCITSFDTLLLEYIKNKFDLINYKNNKFLALSRPFNNQIDCFDSLNSIILNYNSEFLKKYYSSCTPNPQIKKQSKQLGFSFGVGVFQEYIKPNNTNKVYQDVSSIQPLTIGVSAFYQKNYLSHFYLKYDFSCSYMRTAIIGYWEYKKENITITNPSAISEFISVGFSCMGGYKFYSDRKLSINLDLGIFGGTLFGSSKANFSPYQNSGFIANYSIYFISNPNIEYRLLKNLKAQVGLILLGTGLDILGTSINKPSSNYQLLDSKGNYNAFEESSEQIFMLKQQLSIAFAFDL